jgi:hypothetical protein
MMSKYHVCVWIDQVQAKIFEIGAHETTQQALHDHRPKHHLHRKANHVGLGTVEMDPELLEAVAEAIAGAKAILITGPGKARTVLASYLREHHPRQSADIWGVEPSDHPTDAQIVAHARAFFASADRMHA